jgi:tetratricopeptide (TPR) repeat protein
MVSIPLDSSSTDSFEGKPSADAKLRQKRGVRKKYKRKREKPLTEQASDRLRILRQAKYEELQKKSSGNPSIFSFESLFPAPVWDEASIQKDLYEIANRDKAVVERNQKEPKPKVRSAMRSSSIGGSSMMRVWRDPKLSSPLLSYDEVAVSIPQSDIVGEESVMPKVKSDLNISDKAGEQEIGSGLANRQSTAEAPAVDRALTRMVEDRVYGFRRSQSGEFEYDTSLMGDGAVKFRDGVRLGNPLKVNADILNYQAKKEFAKGRLEEAEELYEKALELDPRDGRSYLGLSRIAQRRRDFKLAKDYLRAGISRSVSLIKGEKLDRGPNPFLLQALGCLEERMGNLAQAEALFISAVKSRSSHAAAWVSLAQLRTRKLRQSASAGRVCFQSAERELELAGCPPSSHVYTAWASLEYKKAGDARRARELFEKALKCDPKCSPAWLQLGVLEADNENWDRAQECFENVLRFDQRNSRVLQAYAIMETKRPVGDSRKAIDLFERALRANPRDAGVLQAYALYVAKLGDIDAARNL